MSPHASVYVGEPDIPVGMTIAEYRRTRTARPTWWQRLLHTR
jgi:hypothetical protein